MKENTKTNTVNIKELLESVVDLAKEKKAAEIVSMDLQGLSVICDFFLLMTALNSRQAQSIADNIIEGCETKYQITTRVEGYKEGKWILLDMGDLIVHIFQNEERQYYSLERLWGDTPKENY